MKSHIQIAVEVVVCHSGVDGVEGDVGGGDGIDVIFRGVLVVVVTLTDCLASSHSVSEEPSWK